MTQLLIWNLVINSFGSFNFVWPNHILSDLLGGFEHAAALLVSIVMIKFNGLSIKLCHFTGALNVVIYCLIPLVPQFFAADVIFNEDSEKFEIPENGNSHILQSKALLSTISVLLGITSGLQHVQGYAFASITPYNYCGYVSTGNGIAGVLSFFAYTVLFCIFPRTQQGQIHLIWAFFVFGACCSLIQFVSFYYLSKQSWFLKCIDISKNEKTKDEEQAIADFGEPRSFVSILKDCWLHSFNASFTVFVTLFLFPITGPFGWHQSDDIANCMNGTFQILDLLLRWMPVLGGWTRLNSKLLTVLVLLRPLIMIPLFMLPMRIKGLKFLGDTWWLFILMAIFTITNGWFVTLGALYCPETVTHPREKETVSEIFVIVLLTLVTAGVFASQIPTIGM